MWSVHLDAPGLQMTLMFCHPAGDVLMAHDVAVHVGDEHHHVKRLHRSDPFVCCAVFLAVMSGLPDGIKAAGRPS
jgi:hypothetical protein